LYFLLTFLNTTFVSFDHCLVLPTYGFWLPHLLLLTTVLYFLLTFSNTTFVSFDHCLVLPTYCFWLPHLYLLTTVLYFLLTASDYHICNFWPLSCTSYLPFLITTFVSFDHCLVLTTYASDYQICIFWPPSCSSYLRLLNTTFVSFDHRLLLPTYGFWLPLLYLLTTILYFLLTASDYHICIFWPPSCTSYLRLLNPTFVSFDHCLVFPTYGFWLPHLCLFTTVLYFLLTASEYHICIFWPPSCTSYLRLLNTTFVSFDHRLVLSTFGFWLPHLYLLTTVLYFLLTASDYHICIFWSLFCISYLRLLITTVVSFDHCLVFPTYGFWLPHL
jgi:hypothetical protein